MHHEVGIAQDILHKVLHEAQRSGLKKVRKASVRIGETLLAHPDEVKHSFSAVSQGTAASGAELEIAISPLRAKCSSCGRDFEAEGMRCPFCKSGDVEMISGRELLVETVE